MANLNSVANQIKKLSTSMNAATFKFNRVEALKERKWSERMSNTSHQREVQDLIAAGLNPTLSANNGAASYSGASASGSDATSSALAGIYATQLSNANSYKMNKENLDLSKNINNRQLRQNNILTRAGLKNQYNIAMLNHDASLNASAAQRYAADQNRAAAGATASAMQYAADRNAAAQQYAASQAAYAQMYGADQSLKGKQYEVDYSRNGSWSGLLGSMFNKMSGDWDWSKGSSAYNEYYNSGY